MSKHLKRINNAVQLQLGTEHIVSKETAIAIAQEVVNDRYRKIIKDNINFLQAIEMLEELRGKGGKKK